MQQLAIDIPNIAHTHILGTSNLPSALTVCGLPMEELLWEISKPLLPLEKAGVLIALIIKMMAERLTTGKVGALSKEASLPSCLNFWNFVSNHRVQMMTTNLKRLKGDQRLDQHMMLARVRVRVDKSNLPVPDGSP